MFLLDISKNFLIENNNIFLFVGIPGCGFGGSCFPKDINALIKVAEKMDVPPNILSAAWDTNTLVRPEKDWEELKGRAVVEEKA